MGKPRILFLTTGENKIHLRLIKSLPNVSIQKLYTMNKWKDPVSNFLGLLKAIAKVPSDYDVIICESNYYYPALKKMLGLLPNTKIVNMNTSPLLYYVLKKKLSFLYYIPLKFLLRYVDGYISIGRYGTEIIEALGEKKPHIISYPSIPGDLPQSLFSLRPDIHGHNIAIIVRKDPVAKGLHIAADATRLIANKYPDVRLHVIGKFRMDRVLEDKIHKAGNVILHGWVDDLSAVLQQCSIYLHPGLGEPFGMGVLEAMTAGLIPVVSTDTGMKEFVVRVSEKNVVPPNATKIAYSIFSIFRMSESERKSLSDTGREVANTFRRNATKTFREDFSKMLKTIR